MNRPIRRPARRPGLRPLATLGLVLLTTLAALPACTPPAQGDDPVAAVAPTDEPARSGGWRLADEDSPYLRQHADNPVAWYPWGAEAFARARELDRPVFLSIGYSSCHWCHVMERESFADPEVAAYLNAHYVCIKVDREQRPDVDARYMQAVQAMGLAGGWPLSVWLTPDGKAFWGATYLPPESTPQFPSFLDVARGMVEAWGAERETIQSAVDHNTALLLTDRMPEPAGFDAGAVLAAAGPELLAVLDPVKGGRLSPSPMRFPPSMLLRAAFARSLRDPDLDLGPALVTLDAMANGGLHDHVAGGFHRYSVDPDWRVPHFEKMLYDNGLLATVYAEAHALTGAPRHARTARRAIAWLLEDMRSPEGLLFAARDADSLPWRDGHGADDDALHDDHGAKEEGDVYAWTPDSLVAALGPEDGARAAALFGVTEEGRFERGLSTLVLPDDLDALAAAAPGDLPADLPSGDAFLPWYDDVLARLAAARATRPQAFRDEKCLAAWNGLALSGLARASRYLEDEDLRTATADLARAVSRELLFEDGDQLAVHHQVFDGRASGAGTLDDHAAVARGLLDAYEATGQAPLLARAWRLAATLRTRFEDPERGGFLTTRGDDPLLPGRTRQIHDSARPSGQSLALQVLARLAPLDDSGALTTSLDRALTRLGPLVPEAPDVYPSLVLALEAWHGPLAEVVLEGAGDAGHAELLAAARRQLLPAELLISDASEAAAALAAAGLGTTPSLLAGKGPPASGGIAWVCKRGVCRLPATTPEQLAASRDFVLHHDG